jgi:hypothetical protein
MDKMDKHPLLKVKLTLLRCISLEKSTTAPLITRYREKRFTEGNPGTRSFNILFLLLLLFESL